MEAISVGVPGRVTSPYTRTSRRLLVTAAVCVALFVITYALLIRTRDGQVFDALAYRGRSSIPWRYQALSNHVLASVEIVTVAAMCLLLVVVGAARRLLWRGVCAAGGFGAAVVATQFLKPALPRPELISAQLESGFVTYNTFPSGHATIFTSAALAVVLLSTRRARPWVAIVAAVVTTGASTGVLISGWHRGSDAIGAVFLSVVVMSLAVLVAVLGERAWARAEPARASWSRQTWAGPIWLALVAMVAMLCALWLVILFWRNTWHLADAGFGIMASAIIVVTWAGVVGFAAAVRDLR